MQKKIIYLLIVIITSLYLGGCSTEAMSFSQGFIESYNERMEEERYINNLIRLEKEKQKTYLLLSQ
jgi:outer membrane PBP1 activator LpoA protein